MTLTDRQLELTCHLANGMTIAEIADHVHLSKSSVEKTLTAARRKAGARTLPHLVSIVIAQGRLYWTPGGRSVDDPSYLGRVDGGSGAAG